MKRLLRKLVMFLPGAVPLMIVDLWRRLRYPQVRREHRAHRRVFRRLGSPQRVMQGPFAGLHYLSRAYYGTVLPKIAGTYELELRDVMDAIIRMGADRIIDVGAAEGYYAVGLAVRSPATRMICFEMDEKGRYLLGQLAERNSVRERIEVLGACTPPALEAALAGARRAVVICDCEGYEDELMDPNLVEALKNATLLIELHEEIRPGVTQRIKDRFCGSHEIQVIDSRPRRRDDLPAGLDLGDEAWHEALKERDL